MAKNKSAGPRVVVRRLIYRFFAILRRRTTAFVRDLGSDEFVNEKQTRYVTDLTFWSEGPVKIKTVEKRKK